MHSSEFPSASNAAEADLDPRVRFDLRYDDLTQHGHLKQVTLPLVLGRVCFDHLWAKHPLFETRKQGITPILSRLVLETEPIAVSFGTPLEGRGRIELAHERGQDGNHAVSALFMNGFAEIWALPSRRNPAVDVATRQLVRVGRAFGEHVLTRPFGPANERKVTALAVPGQPPVPEIEHKRMRVDDVASVPPGAQPSAAEFVADDAVWAFGLSHTDLNHHVNSIVYARLFEEAALRHCARYQENETLFPSRIELAYRKPCFAGQSLTCMLQSYRLDHGAGELGVIGYLAPPGTPKARAHCSFRLQFRRLSV